MLGMILPVVKTLSNDTLKGFAVNMVKSFKEFIQKKTEEANTVNEYGLFSFIQNGELIIIPLEINSEGAVTPHTKDMVVIDRYLDKVDYKKAVGLIVKDMDNANGITILEAIKQSTTEETPGE